MAGGTPANPAPMVSIKVDRLVTENLLLVLRTRRRLLSSFV
jgi:hypothetical protein